MQLSEFVSRCQPKGKRKKKVDFFFSYRKQILKAAKETQAEFITQNFLYRADLK